MNTLFHNIGVAIQHASQIERLLEETFAEELASFQQETGKVVSGLGDKVKALEIYLSDAVKKDLWVIVKIRNKVAHEATFGTDCIEDYIERCNRVISSLKGLSVSKTVPSDKLDSTSNIQNTLEGSSLRKKIQWVATLVFGLAGIIWGYERAADGYALVFIAFVSAAIGYTLLAADVLVVLAVVVTFYVAFNLLTMTLRKTYEFFTDNSKTTITSTKQQSSNASQAPQHEVVAKKVAKQKLKPDQ